jgi:hypothetical protein
MAIEAEVALRDAASMAFETARTELVGVERGSAARGRKERCAESGMEACGTRAHGAEMAIEAVTRIAASGGRGIEESLGNVTLVTILFAAVRTAIMTLSALRWIAAFAPLALGGCYLHLSAANVARLGPTEAAQRGHALLFASDEAVAGTGLRRVLREPSRAELFSLVFQEADKAYAAEANYCVAIALTKAAMMQFGVTGVARSIVPDAQEPSTLLVTLRNGEVVRVTEWQRRFTEGAVALGPTPRPHVEEEPTSAELKRWIRFYFTVMTSRIAATARVPDAQGHALTTACRGGRPKESDPERHLFRASLSVLVNGFRSPQAPTLLGLVTHDWGYSSSLSVRTFQRLESIGGMVWTSHHVMFATGLSTPTDSLVVVEHWGHPTQINEPLYKYLVLDQPTTPEDSANSALRLDVDRAWDPDLNAGGFVCTP